MPQHILAIDQGTTSTRAMVFDADAVPVAIAQEAVPQHFPASGWVEHEPEDLWTTTLATCRAVLRRAGLTARDIAAIGIANQRETTVVWDRTSGEAVCRAIVWQDRRTARICAALRADGHEPLITARTGLVVDPYFSGTKIAWILDTVPGARARAERGELLFGTVDSYLLWRLGYQTVDLLVAMRADWPAAADADMVLRVDGGMAASDWTIQRLCDLLDAPVDRPRVLETTALGVAYLAGLSVGLYPEPERFADLWQLERRFRASMTAETRQAKLAGWRRAVRGLLASAEG